MSDTFKIRTVYELFGESGTDLDYMRHQSVIWLCCVN